MNSNKPPTPVIRPHAERRAAARDHNNAAASNTGKNSTGPSDTALAAPAKPTSAQAQNQALLAIPQLRLRGNHHLSMSARTRRVPTATLSDLGLSRPSAGVVAAA